MPSIFFLSLWDGTTVGDDGCSVRMRWTTSAHGGTRQLPARPTAWLCRVVCSEKRPLERKRDLHRRSLLQQLPADSQVLRKRKSVSRKSTEINPYQTTNFKTCENFIRLTTHQLRLRCSLELSHFWETDSSPARKGILHLLWNPRAGYCLLSWAGFSPRASILFL
jgi:hypothetical protein